MLEIYIKEFLTSCKNNGTTFFYKEVTVDIVTNKLSLEGRLLKELKVIESNKDLVFCIFVPTMHENYVVFNFFVGLEKNYYSNEWTVLLCDDFEGKVKNAFSSSISLDNQFLIRSGREKIIAPKFYSYTDNAFIDYHYAIITDYLSMHFNLNVAYGTFNIKEKILKKNFFNNFFSGVAIATSLLILFVMHKYTYCNPPKPDILYEFPIKNFLFRNKIIFYAPVNVENFVNYATAVVENKEKVEIRLGVYEEFKNIKKIKISKENHFHVNTYLKDYHTSCDIFQGLTHNKFSENLEFTKLSDTDLYGYYRAQYILQLLSIDTANKFDFNYFDKEVTSLFIEQHSEQIINSNVKSLKSLLVDIKKEYTKTIIFSSNKKS